MNWRVLTHVLVVAGTVSAMGGLIALHFDMLDIGICSVAMFGGAFLVLASLGPHVWQVASRAKAGELSTVRAWSICVGYGFGLVTGVAALLLSLR